MNALLLQKELQNPQARESWAGGISFLLDSPAGVACPGVASQGGAPPPQRRPQPFGCPFLRAFVPPSKRSWPRHGGGACV